MPLCLKQATIIPLLKSYWLNKEDMKNSRPISNLSFISKLIEKVVTRHLVHSDLNDSYQSAYRRGQSTETDLLKVHCGIAETLNEGFMAALIMQDVSAAVDIIDHPILLKRL